MEIKFTRHKDIRKPQFEGTYYVVMCEFKEHKGNIGKWGFCDFNNLPFITDNYQKATRFRRKILIYIKPISHYWNKNNIRVAKIIL